MLNKLKNKTNVLNLKLENHIDRMQLRRYNSLTPDTFTFEQVARAKTKPRPVTAICGVRTRTRNEVFVFSAASAVTLYKDTKECSAVSC